MFTLKTVSLADREGMWTCSLLFCLLTVSWTLITHGSLKTSMLYLIVRLALNSTINFTVPISPYVKFYFFSTCACVCVGTCECANEHA